MNNRSRKPHRRGRRPRPDDLAQDKAIQGKLTDRGKHPRRDDRRRAKPAQEKPIHGKAASERSFTAPARQPVTTPKRAASLAAGSWLFTCRTGSERDVQDELMHCGASFAATAVAPALVAAQGLPASLDATRDLAFVRQGFKIKALVRAHDAEQSVLDVVLPSLRDSEAYALHVWVPDSPEGNANAAMARALEERLNQAIASALPGLDRTDSAQLAHKQQAVLVQICVIDTDRLAVGLDPPSRAISLVPGGRTRTHVAGSLPSRSARKLEEALHWLTVTPGAGELCVDLGAAPGGWTYVLSNRGARVIAVDPAALRGDVAARRNVTAIRQNAFQYSPPEPVDWLFCDMAYRPLEVAALLAKWANRRWARLLVANIKLPMTKKVDTLWRVKETLERGGWQAIRARQLYHDRDEVTVHGYAV